MEPAPAEGLYIHFPFCVSLCPYCDFVVVAGSAARGPRSRVDALVHALHLELELRSEGRGGEAPLRSVYLGGGTPSLLPATQVAALLELSLIHISEPTRLWSGSRLPSCA